MGAMPGVPHVPVVATSGGFRVALAAFAVTIAMLLSLTGSALAEQPRLLVIDAGTPGTGNSQLLSFAQGANGDVAPSSQLGGGQTGLVGSSAVAREPGGAVWVSNSTQNSLTEYSSTQSGGGVPVRTIAGPDTQLSTPRGIAFDPAGRLFVANQASRIVTVYAPGASGDASPVDTVRVGPLNRITPWGLAFDAVGALWVSDPVDNLVARYDLRFGGAASIIGTATGLRGPQGVAVAADGRLLVANGAGTTVTEYAPGATGDAAPVATLSAPKGATGAPVNPAGVAVDAAGQIWVTYPSIHRVDEFGPGASVSSAPIASISGPRTTMRSPIGVVPVSSPAANTATDTGTSSTSVTMSGTVNPDGSPTAAHFEWGTTTAYGSNTAERRIGSGPGPRTFGITLPITPGTTYHYRLVASNGVGTAFGADRTFSAAGGDGITRPMLYVVPARIGTAPSIVVFAPGARGDIEPVYTIAGPHTGLSAPAGLALDAHGDLFVADLLDLSILEYAAGARGDAAPIARITIPGTSFQPGSVAIDPAGHLLVGDDPYHTRTVRRFTLVAGQWQLDATIPPPGAGSSPAGVAVGPDGRTILADRAASIDEWRIGPDGLSQLAARITGANTTLQVPIDVAADGAGSVFLSDAGSGTIDRFAPAATGNVAPTSTLFGPFLSFALDSSDRLVAGEAEGSIAEFAAGASGHTPPAVSIAGPLDGVLEPTVVAVWPPQLRAVTTSLPAATLGTPYTAKLVASGGFGPYTWSLADPKSRPPAGLTLDPSGVLSGTPSGTGTFRLALKVVDHSNPAPVPLTVTIPLTIVAPVVPSIYLTDGVRGALSDFPLAATGDTAPTFVLNGQNGIIGPAGVVVDSTGRVYVTSSNDAKIAEYPPGAGAFAQPDRTIVGSNTGLRFPQGIALDSAGGVYAANTPAQSVTYYAPGASGNAAPARTITGPSTGLIDPETVSINASGDLWVANPSANTLVEFAPGANGDASPIATVTAPAFLNGPQGLAQDAAGNLLVANRFGDSILRFAANANGISTPVSMIQGPDTGLNRPFGIDIDAQGRIVVSNEFGGSITVYAANATDDAQPVQTIAGPNTGMSDPSALAVVPPLSVQTTRLPRGTVGSLYTASLRASLGSTPYRWRLVGRRLPAGLRLTRAGKISGVPRQAVRRRIRMLVTDASHPQMRASANVVLVTRCPSGRRGPSCRLGALSTHTAKLRLLVCHRSRRCIRLVPPLTLRVLAGRLRVTLVRGRTIYGRGTAVGHGTHERIDIKLSRPLRRAIYTLRERTPQHRATLVFPFGVTLFNP